MSAGGTALARARSDAADRLVSAEEPLATLQRHCGGEIPGTIAIPALLELVRKARHFRLKLARAVIAQDGAEQITAWIEAIPCEGEDDGCDIVLRSWQASAIVPEDLAAQAGRNAAIVRELAELTARLDPAQRLLAVDCEAVDLQSVAAEMREGLLRPWTDFVTLTGSNHRQPMHWRLLDGAVLEVPGSSRTWRAHLFPHAAPDGEPHGFELCLTSDEALGSPLAAAGLGGQGEAPAWGTVGRDIAPVLRQPLARIIANAETIRTRLAGPLADQYSDYAADIATAGQHLLALLDDLADLEVVEAADFAPSPDAIDLADLARRAAGILGMRARERGITVEVPEAGESLAAVGEFRRVLQVLLNLVGNAIRYAPENSQIWLRLEADGERARILVADQGPGLDAEQAVRIFEKFERLGRSGDGGSGLGLYISRRLARAMGGELDVRSTPGEGATFILELPVRAPEEVYPQWASDRNGATVLPRLPGQRRWRDDSAVAADEPDQP